MQNYFLVAVGSALGGVLRYWLTDAVHKFLPFNIPYGTLFVNVTGSFIIGLVIFYFDAQELISPQLKLFLTIGICGGLTTFSTFSLETVNLLRDSEYLMAAINTSANLFLTLTAVVLAYYFAKIIS